MRYYRFTLAADAEYIKENTRFNIREYGYDDPINALNNYFYKNLKNDICFFVYREECGMHAAFYCNEKKISFDDVYGSILEMLDAAAQIRKIKAEPVEITMFQIHECMREARRRGLVSASWILTDGLVSNLFRNEYYPENADHSHYRLEEKMIPEKPIRINGIYDKSVAEELANIEKNKAVDFEGNLAHYVISAKSTQAAGDITEVLMQRLAAAGRVGGRRMEMISNLDPDLYCKNNYFEDVIEYSGGGVIVIDLSEKLGCDPLDYGMVCKYLEGIMRRYKKECLFVFTYNADSPGFAFQFIKMIQKHTILVKLREGTGNRRAATEYLRRLIADSDCAGYASLAEEFMKMYPGNKFSQTEIFAAFEQFEPWCLNQRLSNAYDFNLSDGFMLDRDEDDGVSYDSLDQMIGLASVKKQIDDVIKTDIVEKERKKRLGSSYESGTMHMVFGGNPGTAKTTVAKLFAKIAKDKGILKSGAFVERGGMDLDGLGCVWAIRRAFEAAEGGVLFIDEAYSMQCDTAVTTLIQEMENNRENVIVILAGYNERMKEFMDINEGMRSRVPYWIDFPDYSVDELTDIFCLMMKQRRFSATEEAVKKARNIFEKARYMDNFGNGRYVRNLLDHAIRNQSVRVLNAQGDAASIGRRALFRIIGKDIESSDTGILEDKPVGAAKKELQEMTGLASAKAIIHKAVASFKIKKLSFDKGISKDKPSMHMVFMGNPGTAKTTVARLFAEILKDEKVLPSGNFVEVGRADVVGDHMGATAKLVKRKFREAQGGVLFIDEAYALCDGCAGGYGDEAINTIVQEMENHREDVIVVFAGYPGPMKHFLERNPGMSSRIAFQVEFEDYSVDELCEITRLMLKKKKMTITPPAMEKLRSLYETAVGNKDFGNGRFVRKVLEEAEMNLAQRVAEFDESEITAQMLTTIEKSDIPQNVKAESGKRAQVGFRVA